MLPFERVVCELCGLHFHVEVPLFAMPVMLFCSCGVELKVTPLMAMPESVDPEGAWM